jgi:hypothetical protein
MGASSGRSAFADPPDQLGAFPLAAHRGRDLRGGGGPAAVCACVPDARGSCGEVIPGARGLAFAPPSRRAATAVAAVQRRAHGPSHGEQLGRHRPEAPGGCQPSPVGAHLMHIQLPRHRDDRPAARALPPDRTGKLTPPSSPRHLSPLPAPQTSAEASTEPRGGSPTSSRRTAERGSVGPAPRSSTICLFRRFATVSRLMPSSRLSSAFEACDRRNAALTARVVVTQP